MIDKKIKPILYVFVAYINPLTYFWFKRFYVEPKEVIFTLFCSLLLSLFCIFIMMKLLKNKASIKFFLSILLSSILVAVLVIILDQFMLTGTAVGFEYLGYEVFPIYVLYALTTPAFSINFLILLFYKILKIGNSKITGGNS